MGIPLVNGNTIDERGEWDVGACPSTPLAHKVRHLAPLDGSARPILKALIAQFVGVAATACAAHCGWCHCQRPTQQATCCGSRGAQCPASSGALHERQRKTSLDLC